jgi:hypothetical protein
MNTDLNEFATKFGVLTGVITIIATVVSLAIIAVSNSIGKKTLYAKIVSENRVQWLYKLRRMIYKFIKISREDKNNYNELTNIKNQIQLYYNIQEQDTLVSLLNAIIADKNNEVLKDKLIEYCQITFKSEWEKVKKEAGEPLVKRVIKRIKVVKIRKWCEKYPLCLSLIAIILFVIILRFISQWVNISLSNIKLSYSKVTDYNIINDVVNPIAFSIIAAIIFWFIFNFIPDRKRYLKVRPKVEYNMYSIYKKLFNYIDLTLKHSIYSPSMFQDKIRGELLKKEDFILGLQNKCLNDSYLFDENSSSFIVIGDSLLNEATKISDEIDKLFNFNNYLCADEILLLEKIRTKLFTYEYKGVSQNKIGDKIYTCINPNVAYMADNIFELYKLFIQLQNIIFSNKYTERDIFLNLVQYYYYSCNYKQCQKQVQMNLEKYQDCKGILQCYDFLCDYMLNRKDEFYKKIENLFKAKIDLVSNRNFLKPIIKDDRVQELLKQYFTENDLERVSTVIDEEENMKTIYNNQALALKEYYRMKTEKGK